MKKLIASLLTVATVVSMASFSAFAAPATKAVVKVTLDETQSIAASATAKITVGSADCEITNGTASAITDADTIGGMFETKGLTGYAVAYDDATNVLTFTADNAGSTSLTVTISGVTATKSVTDGADVTGEDKIKADFDAGKVVDKTAYVEGSDDSSSTDTVKTDKSVYYLIKGDYADIDDFDLTASKGDDAKAIKAISVVQKDWVGKEMYALDGKGTKVKMNDSNDVADSRLTFVKIEMAENFTDKEFHVSFDLKVKADKDDVVAGVKKGDSVKFEDVGKVYVKNAKPTTDDVTYAAGVSGIVVKPEKNEDNTVEWEDNNDTIAKLTFEADSDVNAFYPKLSTKWDDSDYAENFADTDAFIRSFVGTPTISSTSRPVLELYNPFVDEDGEETVAAEDVVIYEVVDGALVDSTAKFTAGENDDGDTVFTIKTRTLGTYIFSNGAATAAEEAPAEEAPSDVKENPGTGRF